MRIILSPAKTMKIDNDIFSCRSMPMDLDITRHLMEDIKELSIDEAKNLWKCSDKLANENYERFQNMNLEKNLTPAIFTYEGLVFKHIAPKVLSTDAIDYLSERLFILSGFYGALKCFDGVTPYRLEMQSEKFGSFKGKQYKNLYELWNDRIYKRVRENNKDKIIINLASKEYSQCIENYLSEDDIFINCIFFNRDKNGKLRIKATEAKMARGGMVRFIAENSITDIKYLKKFEYNGFKYMKELSDDRNLCFVKEDKLK